jgi:virulence-associated protein VagC
LTVQKKLFKHGGSYAVDLPMSFVKDSAGQTVVIEREGDKLVLSVKRELDTIEAEPEFKEFARALLQDSLSRRGKLRRREQVWDAEWDKLLKDVPRAED